MKSAATVAESRISGSRWAAGVKQRAASEDRESGKPTEQRPSGAPARLRAVKPLQYFEDMRVGDRMTGDTYVVDRDELVEFARKWDPLPFHVDEEAGRLAFGSLTAPGTYVLAVKQALVHRLPERHAVIASSGYDEVRFHEPVRPGDTLTLVREWVSKRASTSKPDRGVVTLRLSLLNQHGRIVMSHLDTILVRRREG